MTAEALHFLLNVLMVCRNDDDVRELGLNGSFIDTMHQCLSRDQAERLPGRRVDAYRDGMIQAIFMMNSFA